MAKKLYVKTSTKKNTDGERLIKIEVSPSKMDKCNFLIFIDK